ncbi:MAG: hypothetical protein Q9209_005962 [Squamulea sp. 1 TL-2023]
MNDWTTLIYIITGVVLALQAWRFWVFQIIPATRPDDPRELPYWIPFLGHMIGFFQNSFGLLQHGREYFKPTGEPFSITVGGQCIYVLPSTVDVEELYKNTTTLSWEVFVQDLYRWIGFSPGAIRDLWQPPTARLKNLNSERIFPPNEMMMESVIDDIQRRITWERLKESQISISQESKSSSKISLYELTSHTFIRSLTEIYWGKEIFEVDPNFLQIFALWEKTNWKYVNQIPHFLSRDMYRTRDRLIEAFTRYFSLPKSQRSDTAWFIPRAEAEMRDIGLDDRDLGRAHMLQNWAINGNMHKVTFWILAHLLHTRTLLDAIRQETSLGVVDGSVDVGYLVENCPQLDSVYHEVLRLYMSNSLMRHVTSPTKVGGKTFREGGLVLVPYRLLHLDPHVWGANAAAFDADRFLHNNDLTRNPSYRPFGGGQHLCPGRYLAKRAIYTFIAVVLARFEIRLDETTSALSPDGIGKDQRVKQKFPRAENLKPGLATLGPRDGEDVLLCCSPRKAVEAKAQVT